MNIEEERDALRREVRGLQEMIYQILNEVGEPVVVPAETLKAGVVGNKQISVVQDTDADCFIFSLTEVPDE